MRKITYLKTMLVAIVLIYGSARTSAQVLLTEDFDYSIGQVITPTTAADPMTGWLSHSGVGTGNIAVTNGLSFAGYAGSGVGGAAYLGNNGEDINKTFTAQTSGVFYISFLVKIDAVSNAGYFFNLGPNPMGSTYYSRVWVNATANGIGLGAGSTAPTSYISVTTGSTVLLVLKHDFTANTSSLFVLSSFSSTEPTANTTIAETQTSYGALALRQYDATQRITVDGIRVANTWADAVAPSYTLPVATPTFSPAPGRYAGQNITINSSTLGASIYYTIDGTTPDNSGTGTSMLYTGTPFSVNATTTIKAVAYLTGMTTSNVSKGIFTYPSVITSVSALRVADPNGFYKLTANAIITFQSTTSTNKTRYIQDATAGIMLYDGGLITGTYNLYDGLTGIVGSLSTYNGMLEFIPFNNPGVATSFNNPVTPALATLATLATYPGQLVKVMNVTITGTGNFASAISYVINDGAAGVLRTNYTDVDYLTTATAIPTAKQDITGVVLNYSTTVITIVPRSAADIVPSVINDLDNNVNKSMNISTINGTVKITAVGGENIEIYNSTGQKLIHKLAVEGINTIPINSRGVILVKVDNHIAKVIL